MGSSPILLAVSSGLVLLGLIVHSVWALPRRRALAFWGSVFVYGLARGFAVRLLSRDVLGASVPYVLHAPSMRVLGVSVQELAGWAIVCYLGWWLGWRFSAGLARPVLGARFARGDRVARRHRPRGSARHARPDAVSSGGSGGAGRITANGEDAGPPRLFPQVLWASLFLGAIGWAVEAAAASAGWWHWTVPVSSRFWLGVPFIGIVDWFFAGVDFLLPFMVLTSKSLKRDPLRWLTLMTFPFHFAGHVFTGVIAPWLPIPIFHTMHWVLLALLVWLTLRTTVRDEGFSGAAKGHPAPGVRALRELLAAVPLAGFVCIALVAAIVDLTCGHPERLASLLPAVAAVLGAALPQGAIALMAASLTLAPFFPPAALGAAPPLAAALVRWARPSRAWVVQYILVGIASVALIAHTVEGHRQESMRQRLDEALALRAQGDLDGAVRMLADLSLDNPDSHAVHAFLGEIYYRTGHHAAAREEFLAAVRIKSDFLEGYRYAGAIDLLAHDPARAQRDIREGLQVDPDDPELTYLASRAAGIDRSRALDVALRAGPEAIEAVAGLAFEVGDLRGADAALATGLARWPDRRSFQEKRARIAPMLGRDQGADGSGEAATPPHRSAGTNFLAPSPRERAV